MKIKLLTEKGDWIETILSSPTPAMELLNQYCQAWRADAVMIFGKTGIPAREIVRFVVEDAE